MSSSRKRTNCLRTLRVTDAVEKAAGPLLVEMDKANGSVLGISVACTTFKGKSVICIDSVQPASIADR